MAEGLVRARVQDGMAVLRLNQPPSNAMTPAMCAALAEAVGHFDADPAIEAIVLGAEGKVFSAGLDLRALEQASGKVTLGEVCQRIEACSKPVVAALQGAAVGGGAELALAAHYRIASREATLGLPDIGLGLPPGAGGSQRLTRLVGPKVAIQMMTGGRPVNEMVAQKLGLFDALVHEGVLDRAVVFARGKPARPSMAEQKHMRDGAAFMHEIGVARRRLNGSFAKSRVVDCVEAGLLLPRDAALAFERGAWEECLAHRESRALRHVFLAERQVSTDLLRGQSVTPKGQTIMARLYAAQDRAIVAMVRAGTTEAEVDGAMVGFGFAAGPFGGRKPLPAAQVQTVQRRIVAAVMAEGARCLEQGQVARAADLDALAVHAMGFPRHRGGPMKAAELMGLLGLSRQMQGWAQEDPVWAVPDVLHKAVLQADGFAALEASAKTAP